MKRPESLSLPESFLEVYEEEGELRVGSKEYCALFREGSRYLDFYDAHEQKWASFFIPGSMHTAESPDETCSLGSAEYEIENDCVTVQMAVDSTQWRRKTAVWKFRPGVVETYFELEGEGRITTCNYFGGDYADQKDSGFFPSEAGFTKVFCPEPNGRVEPVRSAAQPSEINVHGMGLPGRHDWIFTPAPFCFGFAGPTEDKWLNVGIAARIEDQNFTELRYEPRQDAFSLKLDYEGHGVADGNFKTPSVLLHFTDDPYEGIAAYRHHSEQLGYLDKIVKPPVPDWHRQPGFCGWGGAVRTLA